MIALTLPKRSKFHNIKVVIDDGHTFDSRAEARHYEVLKLRQLAGEIADLEVHPRYLLIEGFTDGEGHRHRAAYYEADFQYFEGDRLVVVDVKGKRTDVFNLKEKLFRRRYPEILFRVIKV